MALINGGPMSTMTINGVTYNITDETKNFEFEVDEQNNALKIARYVDDTIPITNDNNTIMNSPEYHNSIYRGKDLTNIYTIDQICAKISAGTFEDLFIGDYITISVSNLSVPWYNSEGVETTQSVSFTTKVALAGFNTYQYIGDTNLSKNHAVMVPITPFFNSMMNATHTTAGSYYNSFMHQKVLPALYTALQSKLNNHILTYRDLLANSTSTSSPSMAGAGFTGCSNNWSWYDTNLRLMHEIDLYGSTVWSSSGYDTGCANRQLPLFKLRPRLISAERKWCWLSTVASSSHFCDSSNRGVSDCSGAGYSSGVRPRFLIG